MLEVFFTVDVEIWCDGWSNLDKNFPIAYRQYILGSTTKGDYGLPFHLKLLKDYGILGTFFVETLFSTRFGSQPLEEIVGLIQDAGHEVQLHLHTEWVSESIEPLIVNASDKRQYMFCYSVEEQIQLIKAGLSLLKRAGVPEINAFRAGSFGFNLDTLHALAANEIDFDSSYSAKLFGPLSGMKPGMLVVEPLEYQGVFEYPLTVFKDGIGSLRHVQLTACSYNEMERLLWQALERERSSFVILSHNFEMLSPCKTRPDEIVIERFRKLCRFLERNQDSFRICGFRGLNPRAVHKQPVSLAVDLWRTGKRILEQIYRRKYELMPSATELLF